MIYLFQGHLFRQAFARPHEQRTARLQRRTRQQRLGTQVHEGGEEE